MKKIALFALTVALVVSGHTEAEGQPKAKSGQNVPPKIVSFGN